jgi:hypothetical protein
MTGRPVGRWVDGARIVGSKLHKPIRAWCDTFPDEMSDGEPNNHTGLVDDHPIARVGSPERSVPPVRSRPHRG